MEQNRQRVGIIGSGAMGTLFGFHLASRCEVTMLDSNPAVLGEIERAGGLSVNEESVRPVRIGRHWRDLFGSNVVFLFVKAVDTLRALRPFAGELSPSTPIVSLQNGVGNEDAIKTALGGAVPVVLGITTESSADGLSGTRPQFGGRQHHRRIGRRVPCNLTERRRTSYSERNARVRSLRHPSAPLGKARR